MNLRRYLIIPAIVAIAAVAIGCGKDEDKAPKTGVVPASVAAESAKESAGESPTPTKKIRKGSMLEQYADMVDKPTDKTLPITFYDGPLKIELYDRDGDIHEEEIYANIQHDVDLESVRRIPRCEEDSLKTKVEIADLAVTKEYKGWPGCKVFNTGCEVNYYIDLGQDDIVDVLVTIDTNPWWKPFGQDKVVGAVYPDGWDNYSDKFHKCMNANFKGLQDWIEYQWKCVRDYMINGKYRHNPVEE